MLLRSRHISFCIAATSGAVGFSVDDVAVGRCSCTLFYSCTRVFDDKFPVWMNLRATIDWPTRPPDLKPYDFSLWGIIKDSLYAQHPRDVDQFKNLIEQELRSLNNDNDLSSAIYNSVLDRWQMWSATNGQRFKKFRYRSFYLHGTIIDSVWILFSYASFKSKLFEKDLYSLDWKDRVCQTVKKAFVCLSVCACVCLSVCNTFLRPPWDLLSVNWDYQFLLRQIKQNLSFSLNWSLARFFPLAHWKIEFCDSFDFSASLSLEYGFETSIHSWLMAGFISVDGRCLIVFMFC